MTETARGKSSWGIGMFSLYGLFVVFVLVMVVYAVLHETQLVSPDYYARGISYQQQIDRMNNTGRESAGLTIGYIHDDRRISITFPDRWSPEDITGKIVLVRPYNADLDRYVELQVDRDRQAYVSVDGLPRGMWRLQVTWDVDAHQFFDEEIIVLP